MKTEYQQLYRFQDGPGTLRVTWDQDDDEPMPFPAIIEALVGDEWIPAPWEVVNFIPGGIANGEDRSEGVIPVPRTAAAGGGNPYHCPAGTGITSGRFTDANGTTCNPQVHQLSSIGLQQRQARLGQELKRDISNERRERLEEELRRVEQEADLRADAGQPEGLGPTMDIHETTTVEPDDEGMGLEQFGMSQEEFDAMLERATVDQLKASLEGGDLNAELTAQTRAAIARKEQLASIDSFRDRLTGELSDFESLDGEMSPPQIRTLLEEREFEEVMPGVWADPMGSVVAWDGTSQWFDEVTDEPERDFLYTHDVSALVDEIEADFQRDFWQHPQGVFHATTADHIEGIIAEGLLPSSETRGLGNRGVGAAVFASTLEPSDAYGEEVFLIDVAAMKADGYMPSVHQEPGFAEYEARSALADAIGVEDFHMDIESGLYPDTVVFGQRIPTTYLSAYSTGDVITEAFDAYDRTMPPPRADGTLGPEHVRAVEKAYERARQRPDWSRDSDTSTMTESHHSGDQVFAEILRTQGFADHPSFVSGEEFAKQLADNPDYALMYRGSADEYMAQFEGGEIFGGLGVYGNGTYMAISSDRGLSESLVRGDHKREGGFVPGDAPNSAHNTARIFASWYSDNTWGTPEETLGVVQRYTWAEEPRIAREQDLRDLRGSSWETRNALADSFVERYGEEDGTFLKHRFFDVGTQAAMAGYDAIEVADGSVMLVLNRSKIMVDGSFREYIEVDPEFEVES